MNQSKGRSLMIVDSDQTDIRVDESHLSKLEQRFDERVPEEELKLLFPVVQGLMRFMPSERFSASRALDLLKVLRQKLADEGTLKDY